METTNYTTRGGTPSDSPMESGPVPAEGEHAPPPAAKRVVFLGNPGAGKSTLINCILGRGDARSGHSSGGGMQIFMGKYEFNSVTYIDTPGLADSTLRENAAAQITEALKQGGSFKLIFVMTLESGRSRPQDITTIRTVMKAIKIDGVLYSIIINKLKPLAFRKLSVKGVEFDKVLTQFGDVPRPSAVCFLQEKCELDEGENAFTDLGESFREFIRRAPSALLTSEDVQPVNPEEYEAVIKRLEELNRTLKENNEKLSAALKAQENARRIVVYGASIKCKGDDVTCICIVPAFVGGPAPVVVFGTEGQYKHSELEEFEKAKPYKPLTIMDFSSFSSSLWMTFKENWITSFFAKVDFLEDKNIDKDAYEKMIAGDSSSCEKLLDCARGKGRTVTSVGRVVASILQTQKGTTGKFATVAPEAATSK